MRSWVWCARARRCTDFPIVRSVCATMQRSIWAVVPAAGVGRRMGADVPKQYLMLGEVCILQHTIERLREHPAVRAVIVAVAVDDEYFSTLTITDEVECVAGGTERADSVLNALEYLSVRGFDDDWALVHDAVRPCLHWSDIDQLVEHARLNESGALLATPVRDTMKRVHKGRVTATVAREALWHALTPQLFPVRVLRDALLAARAQGVSVTDDAQAMERAGHTPDVVHGRADNIKITRAEDLELAEMFLARTDLGARR